MAADTFLPLADSVCIVFNFFSGLEEIVVLFSGLMVELKPVSSCRGCVNELDNCRSASHDASASGEEIPAYDAFQDRTLA